jgi:alpha-tubulin suppressor-like RCC1 family protein
MPRITSLLLCLLGCAAPQAQAADRLPVFAGSMHVYVLVEVDGTVKTWGSPRDAEGPYLGDGTDGNVAERDEPTPLPGVHDIADAAVGTQHVLLLARDGTVYAWGRNNMCEVGTGNDNGIKSPVPVAGLGNIKQVAASEGISGAVRNDGTVWVWGNGQTGLLANGAIGWQTKCASHPVKVEGLSGVKKIAVDGSNIIALKEDGSVWGWGKNGGALGDGSTEPRTHPVQMQGISNAVDIALNGDAAIVLADGTVRMTGGTAHTTPYKIEGVANAVSVRSTVQTTIVQLRNGTLLGWGLGYFGVLGDGHGDREYSKPHPPIGLGPVLVHYLMNSENFAIRADGTVMAWGIYGGEKGGWIKKPIPYMKVRLSE